MIRIQGFLSVLFMAAFCMAPQQPYAQAVKEAAPFNPDSIRTKLYLVNDYFLGQQWQRTDRNWIRGTYYTGLMAFQKETQDTVLLDQAVHWAAKHGWRTGTEWTYPANRLTCVQTYLELYLQEGGEEKLNRARGFMEKKIKNSGPAEEQGWDYVDALYVGTPAYMMMSVATSNPAYADYGNRMFRDVYKNLYDSSRHLFYRDEKAKGQRTDGGNRVLWSRGNGWAMASIPRIVDNLPEDDPMLPFYKQLLQEMAASLKNCQGQDGFWRVNLADSLDYPSPESSGTAFFTYAICWGINRGILDAGTYSGVVEEAWQALYNHVDSKGKVLWGQGVARGPEQVEREDSHEYVLGAFLLAGSEMLKFTGSKAGREKAD